MAQPNDRGQRDRKANTEAEAVKTVRITAVDVVEHVQLRRGRLVMVERGDLPLLQLLVQVYERPNVVALDVHSDERALLGLRSLTSATESRLHGLVGKGIRKGGSVRIRLRITAILG